MKPTATRASFDAPLAAWFATQGWKPAPFQREAWRRWRRGESGLLVTPTGSGKTLAALGGPLLDALAEAAKAQAAREAAQAKTARARSTRASKVQAASALKKQTAIASRIPTASASTAQKSRQPESRAADAPKAQPDPTPRLSPTVIPSEARNPGASGKQISRFARNDKRAARNDGTAARNDKRAAVASVGRTRLLWITPLRALASDTARALREPIAALGLDWTVAMRTGDATARDKRLARQGRADALVITPESLALLLSYPDTAAQLSGLRAIVVDEWHELLGNKRGVLLQLALARLRAWSPQARTWGLSATLGNLEQARDVLLPHAPGAAIVQAAKPRSLTLDTLLPEAGERFPWAGHLGLSQVQRVAARLQAAGTTLLFANTRAQAELWHRALAATWLDAPETLALHHGSLDPKLRAAVEQGLREGSVRCVVATSSLDLGVDFPAVDQVIQLGSPKGMARLLQRAGRARHRPGEAGHVVCVPTHALELAEYAAAREALAAGEVESRVPLQLSLDVLAQHCVTLALGGGFEADALRDEVRGTHAFAALTDLQWNAVLAFIVQGGQALQHYPEYRRVVRDDDGMYRVHDRRIALRHRLSIGTITSDGALQVKLLRGATLGSVEEGFLARLRPRDRFQFAGRTLELVRLQDMAAYVRIAKKGDGMVPRWQGGRMPMSGELGARVAQVLAGPRDGPELRALAPLLALQEKLSALPAPGTLLAEFAKTREGWHLFVYPFAGRGVHEGLAALLALRWSRLAPNTFAFAVNDYGLALTAQAQPAIGVDILRALLSPEGLHDDLQSGANLAELARRQFREIARVAGLLPPSLPGRALRSLRQLQASSGLLFDVLQRHDPGHLLLQQAEREVFEAQLEVRALQATLARCHAATLDLRQPKTLTPLSFPLWAEAMRGTLTSEDWRTRVQRAAERLEHRHAPRSPDKRSASGTPRQPGRTPPSTPATAPRPPRDA
ncbi:ligase-associated DNA damage response DEXH box helicase [Luteimonas viscosa]|uniref:Ligase-associated DNA damage response DEXH box helicase n=1 Tax=Luteimonas viscosa TaxID=1132694 RepID=A0A5D4XR37_9GAMM|nr:ligase-associated DNA damage response DEXH box helicase [Luteimonas viscosa]TYT26423.1 ligase-associated DNA damage response DEXH box helicase [Luteimonas viscosa]